MIWKCPSLDFSELKVANFASLLSVRRTKNRINVSAILIPQNTPFRNSAFRKVHLPKK